MPIKFRCAYCNQLMGIARRKAGTIVKCPTCSGQVVVPNPPADEDVLEKTAPRVEDPAVQAAFEGSDIDRVLQNVPALGAKAEKLAEPAPPVVTEMPPPVPRSVTTPAAAASLENQGFYLSSSRATVLTVAGIVLLALAFVAGVLVGKAM